MPNSAAPSAVKPKTEIVDNAMNYARRCALLSSCPTSALTVEISSASSLINDIMFTCSDIHKDNYQCEPNICETTAK
ncbi:hypothetical protein T11_13775 [Trichinella zimbabwensis]|uniref:Uncharacterized protein n=1 Tax=Trichinella zimbabwensis TaxID=268475 RepID=A0A0V1HLR2_9BILA|nr:hypothetical protein T11_13775 [Trichinella zimbabwensis]